MKRLDDTFSVSKDHPRLDVTQMFFCGGPCGPHKQKRPALVYNTDRPPREEKERTEMKRKSEEIGQIQGNRRVHHSA
jgi:hypothetical protein